MKSVTWDDFTKGEHGGLDPRKWPKGAWSGRNVVPYVDGSIGRRAGFRAAYVIDESTPAAGGSHDALVVTMARDTPGEPDVWAAFGGDFNRQVRCFALSDPTGTVATLGGDPAQVPKIGSRRYATVTDAGPQIYGRGSSELEVWSDTDIAYAADTPDGARFALYKDRMVAVYDGALLSTPNVLQFSDPADFESWPGIEFLAVGSLSPLLFAGWQRDHMAIIQRDGRCWVLTGTLSSTARVEEATQGDPIDPSTPFAIAGDGDVFFYQATHRCPVRFDGSHLAEFRHVIIPVGTFIDLDNSFGCDRAGDIGGVVLGMRQTGTSSSWLMHRQAGVWTRHLATVPLGGIESMAALDDRLIAVSSQVTGGARTALQVFVAEFGLQRPPFVFGAPGARQWEDSTDGGPSSPSEPAAELMLGQHWTVDETQLRAVTVDFEKYDTGSAVANQIRMVATVHGLRDNSGSRAETAQTWTEDASVATTDGVDDSVTFYLGAASPGRGFDITLSVLRGVAIRAVTAHHDTPVGTVT